MDANQVDINGDEFNDCMSVMGTIARHLLDDLPLDAFVSACNRADAIAPIADPTLWMRGGEKLLAWRNLATAFAGVRLAWQAVEKLYPPTQEGMKHEFLPLE